MTAQPPPQAPSHSNPAQPKRQSTPDIKFLPALKPRPMVFVALCVLLAAWLATIIVMRFTTIQRDPAPIQHDAAAVAPVAPKAPR